MGAILRCLAALTIMLLIPSMSSSQLPDDETDICADQNDSYEVYEAKIEDARADLRKLEREGASEGVLEAMRQQLADLVFAQDCVRPDLQMGPVRGPAAVGPKWVTLNTFYATNRRRGPTEGSIASYTSERDAGALRFGRVTVSIPTQRAPGDLSLPMNLWLFEMPANPDKHFIIKAVSPLTREAALGEMRNRLGQLSNKSLLIFVHGYNVSFRDAALRTAQLAYDLNFPGLPMFFSWPSAGTTAGYPHDEEMSELSLPAFNALLDRIATLHASEVYIIAHSMGNRVVTRAIAERIKAGHAVPQNLRGLLLAAPDINADIFRDQIAPQLAALSGTRKTIYASNNDVALRTSSLLHDFPRVGLTQPSAYTQAGWDTVDATGAAPVSRAWGHSYVVDSPKVIKDMQALLYQNKSAQARGLAKKGTPPSAYWVLQ